MCFCKNTLFFICIINKVALLLFSQSQLSITLKNNNMKKAITITETQIRIFGLTMFTVSAIYLITYFLKVN